MSVLMDLIKKLREKTGAGIVECKKALEEAKGDYQTALKILKERGLEVVAKKAERETNAGIVDTYIHHTFKSGATVAIACETDFVAKTDEFKNLAHEIAKQVMATDPENKEDLLKEPWIVDPSKTVSDLLKENIAKLGENITIKEFKKFTV